LASRTKRPVKGSLTGGGADWGGLAEQEKKKNNGRRKSKGDVPPSRPGGGRREKRTSCDGKDKRVYLVGKPVGGALPGRFRGEGGWRASGRA